MDTGIGVAIIGAVVAAGGWWVAWKMKKLELRQLASERQDLRCKSELAEVKQELAEVKTELAEREKDYQEIVKDLTIIKRNL